MAQLTKDIRACRVCAEHLPHGPRPVFSAGARSRIVIIGQAPGRRVHESGVPWRDQSGDNLRAWLGVDGKTFYDTAHFALMPMGFCYPGAGASGDLPPRPECAPLWHPQLLAKLKSVKLVLLIGQYAQARYLGDRAFETLTETVRHFRAYGPRYFPLPHPSPRNRLWLRRNPWFEVELLPVLRENVHRLIETQS